MTRQHIFPACQDEPNVGTGGRAAMASSTAVGLVPIPGADQERGRLLCQVIAGSARGTVAQHARWVRIRPSAKLAVNHRVLEVYLSICYVSLWSLTASIVMWLPELHGSVYSGKS